MQRRLLFAVVVLIAGLSTSCGRRADSTSADQPIPPPELKLPRHEPRFGRARPIVAVLAYNPATEVTDFVVPYGVLEEADVAEVVAVATSAGPIQMRAALRFRAETTLADLDARFPEGADYVIVPNIYQGENDEEVLDWIRHQAELGATIVGVCDGVRTLARSGVLRGRRATGHWRTIGRLMRDHPETEWIRNRRYIADRSVITTSGVSASIPVSMALVEALAGPARAEEVGRRLGIASWGPGHDSEQFRLTPAGLATALRNKAFFWSHEELGLAVGPGVDEIRVALIADAYGRTFRASPLTVASSAEPVRTRRGLVLLPDRVRGAPDGPERMLPLMDTVPPVKMLDRSLEEIAERYGQPTAGFVALTMEYAWEGED